LFVGSAASREAARCAGRPSHGPPLLRSSV